MNHKFKALLISGEYPPMEGGVADFTAILAQKLLGWNAQVHVLTSVQASAARTQGEVQVHPLMRSWRFRDLFATMGHLLKAIRPDVVNIQYQTAAYGLHPAINLLPRAFGVPFVATFHDLRVPYLFPKAGALRWWVNLALARACQAVIVTNEQDRARLASHSRIPRLELIRIGSNIDYALPTDYDCRAWRQSRGIPESALVLCYFGFLNTSKGGEELIEALDELCQAGDDVRLLMIGGATGASDVTNPAYLDRVLRSIKERGLEDRVLWTGYLPPEGVSAAFCSADICVLPYRDGASFRRGSLMASFAHRMPIISTYPQVALAELRHGENIYLVPPQEPQRLAGAVARLARDSALRERIRAGAGALSEEFNWQRIAERTLEVYHAVGSPHKK